MKRAAAPSPSSKPSSPFPASVRTAPPGDDPDRVVGGVGHGDLVVGLQCHALRPVEARGIDLPVFEALLPIADQRAGLAGLELRGLCRHPYFGQRTCGRSEKTKVIEVAGS